jgi:hypothetical protein
MLKVLPPGMHILVIFELNNELLLLSDFHMSFFHQVSHLMSVSALCFIITIVKFLMHMSEISD